MPAASHIICGGVYCICVLVARVLINSVEDNTHFLCCCGCATWNTKYANNSLQPVAQPHRKIQMRRSWQSWRRQKKGNRRKMKARINSQCQGENYSISNDARIVNAYFVFVFFSLPFLVPPAKNLIILIYRWRNNALHQHQPNTQR